MSIEPSAPMNAHQNSDADIQEQGNTAEEEKPLSDAASVTWSIQSKDLPEEIQRRLLSWPPPRTSKILDGRRGHLDVEYSEGALKKVAKSMLGQSFSLPLFSSVTAGIVTKTWIEDHAVFAEISVLENEMTP